MYHYFFKKYYPFIIIVILVATNIFTYCYYNQNKNEITKPNVIATKPEVNDTHDMITVDIKGEIKKTGIYQLESGSNINDLISMAGGIKKTGTTANINLARVLSNQSVIVIKKKNTINNQLVETPCVTKEIDISNCDNSSIIEISNSDNNIGEAKLVDVSENTGFSGLININTATIDELMKLTGIGEAKAKSIIDYREKNGPFKIKEDLIKVSGISETIFNKIKEAIEL